MDLSTLAELNWLAVIVGAVVYFVLGAVWYAPGVFGRAWMSSIGWEPEEGAPQMGPLEYGGPFLAYLVAAIAVGMVAAASGSDTFVEGFLLGLVVGIGFAVTTTFVTAVFDPKKPQPMVWFVINGAYHLVGLVIVGVLVSVWR